MSASILLVEDDPDFAHGLNRLLQLAGHSVHLVRSGAEALAAARAQPYALALLDLQLPDRDGLVLLGELGEASPSLRRICLTGRDDAQTALRAMRAGALDYLTKPVTREDLLAAVGAALGPSGLAKPVVPLAPRAKPPVGESAAWRRTMALLSAVARSPRTAVLLTGEPGTGKEVAAELVHRSGPRAAGPFVAANAACLSAGMVESELFGHEVGAFTGAQRRRRGLFELAQGGTLFLDEVGELQSKLLRVLEGRPFRRMGGETELTPDVRMVAATNRDLRRMVAEGKFRADLFERLRVFEVTLPPLRERTGDVMPLAARHLEELTVQLGLPVPVVSPEAKKLLLGHGWPGNVRELRNALERALVLAHDGVIMPEHLPEDLHHAPRRADSKTTLADAVRAHIVATYAACDDNLTRAANTLGISRLALRKRLQAYGLKPVGIEPVPVHNEPVGATDDDIDAA
jgi:DNA-binding NtrC family response regulator